MSTKNGGPAFPVPRIGSVCGMSLLDWFAGQALTGLLLSAEQDGGNFAGYAAGDGPFFAGRAYQLADAMLAERERREGGG